VLRASVVLDGSEPRDTSVPQGLKPNLSACL
jgi:hypothetical protein